MDNKDAAKQLGQMGGKRNVEINGKEHMAKISKLGVLARKNKKTEAKSNS